MRSLMIVDDERNIRYGLKMMIEREFPDMYDIRMAAHGREAVGIYQEHAADIVITDIRMPVMDGIELIKSLADMESGSGRGIRPIVIILSGYDDFEYAKAAIQYQVKDYLLKPIRRDELFAALRKSEEALSRQADMTKKVAESEMYLQQLRIERLKELLELPEGQEMNEENGEGAIGFDAFTKPFWVAVMKYKYMDGTVMNRDELKQLVENLHDGSLGKVNACFHNGAGRVVMVGSSMEMFEELSRTFAVRELDGLFLGISREGREYTDIRKCYREAFTALSYTFIYPNIRLMKHKDIEGQRRSYPVPEEGIRRLGNLLGTERERDLKVLLSEIFHIEDMPNVDIEYLERVSRRINEQVFDEVFRKYGESLVEVLKLYRRVGTMDNFRHFHDYYRNLEFLLLGVNDYIKGVRTAHSEHSEIKAAITFMEENYHKPLNMAMVSNHVSLNYSYFSEAFKNHTGENFVVYLKKLRIAKAKELLEKESMKTMDIGKAVGFENSKQFSRVFKELEGISPHEYRLKLQIEASLNSDSDCS